MSRKNERRKIKLRVQMVNLINELRHEHAGSPVKLSLGKKGLPKIGKKDLCDVCTTGIVIERKCSQCGAVK